MQLIEKDLSKTLFVAIPEEGLNGKELLSIARYDNKSKKAKSY